MTHIKSDLLKAKKSRFSILIRENSDSAKNPDSAKKSDRAHAYITTLMITKFKQRRIDKEKTRNNRLRMICHSFEQERFSSSRTDMRL
jgi:hypothetical protein